VAGGRGGGAEVRRVQVLPPAEQVAHSCALLVGVGVLVWSMPAQVQRFLAEVYVSLQAPRCTAQATLDSAQATLLWMWP
jgi:hypothetical protein